jgi:hypothetical protein
MLYTAHEVVSLIYPTAAEPSVMAVFAGCPFLLSVPSSLECAHETLGSDLC